MLISRNLDRLPVGLHVRHAHADSALVTAYLLCMLHFNNKSAQRNHWVCVGGKCVSPIGGDPGWAYRSISCTTTVHSSVPLGYTPVEILQSLLKPSFCDAFSGV